MHIHYTCGPSSLYDVPLETSNEVSSCIAEGYSDYEILSAFNISQQALTDIKSIHRLRLKRCCFCGELFDPKGRSRKAKCDNDPHFLPCIDCGKLIEVKESYVNYMKAGGRRCPECRAKQIKQTLRSKSPEEKAAVVAKTHSTMIKKYGAPTALQVPEMKAKIQQTVKAKYGVDNLSQSAEIQDRIRANSRKRYGVDHYNQNPEIRQHMVEGMIAKYGVDNAQKCPELQEKTKQTNLEKYGSEYLFGSEYFHKKAIENSMAKYGVPWPRQTPEVIEKTRQTNLKKYGAPMYPISDDYMINVVSDPEKFGNYKAFMQDPEKFISDHYIEKPSVSQICQDTGVTDTTIYDKLLAIGRRDLATEFRFSMETELIEFLKQCNTHINIDKHNRVVLDRKEIDVFLPDLNIGFECNPTYTHNSSFCDPWGEPPKYYKYHADKSELAKSKGIFLYHIFGYEWTHRKEVVKSQIQNLIGANTRTIYGRNTHVVEVPNDEAMRFLEANHRQGSVRCKVNLGLRLADSGELVALMTFSKMRPGIGKKSNQPDDAWELVRFCNVTSTSVVGGASKLFKHFVQSYHPAEVISFSDVAHTRGNLYSTLGFTYVSLSEPGYMWVKLKDDTYYSRVACQKHNLPKLFDDITEKDIASHTENEIMMSHGYARVFDSGVIRWRWVPS